MSLELESFRGPSLEANMVSGELCGVPNQAWVVRFRVGEAESVISLESFCLLAHRYLRGGLSGWEQGKVPVQVQEVTRDLDLLINGICGLAKPRP